MIESTKRELLIKIMQEQHIDILCLQETHINTNCKEEKDGFLFLFSTSVTDKARTEKDKLTKEKEGQLRKTKGKGKGKGKGKEPPDWKAINTYKQCKEHGGVGFIIAPHIKPTMQDYNQISGRNMTITLDSHTNSVQILNTYAPQSAVGKDEKDRQKIKDQYYDETERIIQQTSESDILLIYGDMNARLHARLDTETDIMGKHVFGRGENFLEHNANQDSIDNRFRFVELCKTNGLVITNTLFPKAPQKYCTRKELNTEGWKAPWTPERFAMLDYCLVKQRWRNTVKNVESIPDIAVNSDHCILASTIQIKLKRKPEEEKTPVFKFYKPKQQEIKAYNKQIKESNDQTIKDDMSIHEKFAKFIDNIDQAAKDHFKQIDPKQKQSYIRADTWQLIEDRQTAHIEGDEQKVTALSKQIKKEARKDRLQHRKNTLEQCAEMKEKWQGIKNEKRQFQPNFTKLRDISGDRVKYGQEAQAKAEYLANIQWKKQEDIPRKINPRKIIQHDIGIDDGRITIY